MSTLTKTLRWGLHLLGENAEARIRELTRKVEGLQAAYNLLSATAKAERDEYDRFIARLTPRTYREGEPPLKRWCSGGTTRTIQSRDGGDGVDGTFALVTAGCQCCRRRRSGRSPARRPNKNRHRAQALHSSPTSVLGR